MVFIRIGVLAAFMAVCGVSASAQDAHGHDHAHERDLSGRPKGLPPLLPGTVLAPETPAGRQLAWLLGALEGRDDIRASERMSPEFLQNVPADRLDKVLNDLRSGSAGYVLRKVTERDAYGVVAVGEARSDRSMWRIIIETEPVEPHRITTLFFQPAPEAGVEPLKDWADADGVLAGMGETRSLAVYEVSSGEGGGPALRPVHALNERESLAIGSTFKLFVLGALAERVASGGATWEETLEIRDEHKSLPSGTMQRLPRGTEKPLSEFVVNMLAISDNTATDHVLARVGRGAVESFMKARVREAGRNLPFLSTREAFTIKLSMDGSLLGEYAGSDEAGRRELLSGRIAKDEPSEMVAQQWRVPQRVDVVEWFAGTDELCRLMAELVWTARRPGNEPMLRAMKTNGGVPMTPGAWRTVAFKGGSEPGVLNLTWYLERASAAGGAEPGPAFAVSLTVNDTKQPLDEGKLVGLGQRVVEFLERAGR